MAGERAPWYWWVLRGLGVCVTVACVVAAGRFLWPQPDIAEQPGGTWRQLSYLREALDDGADDAAQQQFPEGYPFMNALYGLAWVQAGHTDPGHRAQALRESRWALARLESAHGRAVFSPQLQPVYGIFWAGWTNWLRGAILTLAGPGDQAELPRFIAGSDEIARAFVESTTPYLQAYSGQAWPVDSTVAIASLRLHDTLLPRKFDPVITRWLDAVKRTLDPATGLLPHQVSPRDGAILQGARATSQSIIHRFLPEIDSGFARAQYDSFRTQYLFFPGGFGPTIREYPTGNNGAGDDDSGPLIAGASLSATAVTLGAARVNGDQSLAKALGSAGELVGLPLTLPGSKRYAFGLVPIADAFLAWSATARLLTAPQPTARDDGLHWWWRAPWLAILAILAAAPWVGRLVSGAQHLRRWARNHRHDP